MAAFIENRMVVSGRAGGCSVCVCGGGGGGGLGFIEFIDTPPHPLSQCA